MEIGADWGWVGQRPIRGSSVNLASATPSQGAFRLPDCLHGPRSFVHGYKSFLYARPS